MQCPDVIAQRIRPLGRLITCFVSSSSSTHPSSSSFLSPSPSSLHPHRRRRPRRRHHHQHGTVGPGDTVPHADGVRPAATTAAAASCCEQRSIGSDARQRPIRGSRRAILVSPTYACIREDERYGSCCGASLEMCKILAMYLESLCVSRDCVRAKK